MADEFGESQAQAIISDLALLELGDSTAGELLAAGEDPRVLWLAICRMQGVPKERWDGLDKKAKNRHAE
jgi:hypothetical protein